MVCGPGHGPGLPRRRRRVEPLELQQASRPREPFGCAELMARSHPVGTFRQAKPCGKPQVNTICQTAVMGWHLLRMRNIAGSKPAIRPGSLAQGGEQPLHRANRDRNDPRRLQRRFLSDKDRAAEAFFSDRSCVKAALSDGSTVAALNSTAVAKACGMPDSRPTIRTCKPLMFNQKMSGRCVKKTTFTSL